MNLGDIFVLAFFLVLIAQISLAGIIWWDAKRVGMEATVWVEGILWPFGGFIIVVPYLYERRQVIK